MDTVVLSNGKRVSNFGIGTWYLGENRKTYSRELEVLKLAAMKGVNVFDTAEMYGSGGAELLLGEMIGTLPDERRQDLFIISKVYPHNAGRNKIFKACENSLNRLKLTSIDLYLLHWRGAVPLQETVECMEELVQSGKIKAWGVSNFDTMDMKELLSIPGGAQCRVNQVLYHLGSRGIEYDLKPYMDEKKIVTMVYCPLAQGGKLKREILNHEAVKEIGKEHGLTPIQVLLAFTLSQPNMISIPRTASVEHLKELLAVRDIRLTKENLTLLTKFFPQPNSKESLDII